MEQLKKDQQEWLFSKHLHLSQELQGLHTESTAGHVAPEMETIRDRNQKSWPCAPKKVRYLPDFHKKCVGQHFARQCSIQRTSKVKYIVLR